MLTAYSDKAKKTEIDGRTRIRSLVFLGDGEYFLTGGDDAIIRQWRLEDGVEVGKEMKPGSDSVTAMDLSGDGKWIVSSGERVANVWSTRSRQITVTVNGHSDWVDTVHVSPDSTKFATGSNDKKAFIWNILTGDRLVGPLEHGDRVGAVRFSPDGDRIVIGTASRGLCIYSAHNGELLRTIPVSVASYPHIVTWFTPQSIIALVSHNSLMHIDVNTGQTFSSWTLPGEPANNFGPIAWGSFILSSNGRFIVSFIGRSISLWDTSTFARISSDFRHSSTIRTIALSPDSNYLAIADWDSKITLRDLNNTISSYYLTGERDVEQPPNMYGNDLQVQMEALHGRLRSLELRFGSFFGNPVFVELKR